MDRHGETWIDDLLVWHFVKTRDLALLAASCSKFAMATCGVAPGPSAQSCSSRCHCSGLSLIKIESLWFYCIYESIIWLICSCHSNWTPNIHQKVFWILRCAAHWPEGSDDSRMANMSVTLLQCYLVDATPSTGFATFFFIGFDPCSCSSKQLYVSIRPIRELAMYPYLSSPVQAECRFQEHQELS